MPLDQVANSRSMVVEGVRVTVRRLKVKRIMALAREILTGLEAISLDAAANAMQGVGIAALLPLIDEDRLARIFGLVTDQDGDWCLENFDPTDTGHLINLLLDVNDVESLRLVFTQAAQKVSRPTSAPASSAPSPS